MWLGHHFQGQNSKGQRSRSPGRFTNRGVYTPGSCSGERGKVFTVGIYCYVAVCRRSSRLGGARRFGAHRGRRGAWAYRGGRPPTACYTLRDLLPFYATAVLTRATIRIRIRNGFLEQQNLSLRTSAQRILALAAVEAARRFTGWWNSSNPFNITFVLKFLQYHLKPAYCFLSTNNLNVYGSFNVGYFVIFRHSRGRASNETMDWISYEYSLS